MDYILGNNFVFFCVFTSVCFTDFVVARSLYFMVSSLVNFSCDYSVFKFASVESGLIYLNLEFCLAYKFFLFL